MQKPKFKPKKNEIELALPKTVSILFSDVQREYFPTEAQYITEKGAEWEHCPNNWRVLTWTG